MSNGTVFQQLISSEAHQLLQEGSPLGAQTAKLHGLVFVAEVFRAGPVMVEVWVDGVRLQGSWPRSLLVLPGKPSAADCTFRGQSKVGSVVSSQHGLHARHRMLEPLACCMPFRREQGLQEGLTQTAAKRCLYHTASAVS